MLPIRFMHAGTPHSTSIPFNDSTNGITTANHYIVFPLDLYEFLYTDNSYLVTIRTLMKSFTHQVTLEQNLKTFFDQVIGTEPGR